MYREGRWSFHPMAPGFAMDWGYPLVAGYHGLYSYRSITINSCGRRCYFRKSESCAWCTQQEGGGGRGEGCPGRGEGEECYIYYIVYTLLLLLLLLLAKVCLRHLYSYILFYMKYNSLLFGLIKDR